MIPVLFRHWVQMPDIPIRQRLPLKSLCMILVKAGIQSFDSLLDPGLCRGGSN
jgi:hypothetical protein